MLLELGERRRANRALRESEERFRSLADNAPVVIWTSGPDTAVTFLNSTGKHYPVETSNDLRVIGWKEVVIRQFIAQFEEYTLDASAGRGTVRMAIRGPTENTGGLLHTITPRLLDDGSLAGYIGIGIDITDLNHNQSS